MRTWGSSSRRAPSEPAITAGLVGLLVISITASLSIGSHMLHPATLPNLLMSYHSLDSADAALLSLRLPRTVLGILAGMALGVSGCLMQNLTRNPLSDPGVLGINAGALLAMALGAGLLGLTDWHIYAAVAFLGATLAALGVHAIGFVGHPPLIPLRLTLAGVAMNAVLGGLATMLILLDAERFDRVRGWSTGAIAVADFTVPVAIMPFILVGLALAFLSVRGLNALALGDELAMAMGVRVRRMRLVGGLAATLLAGAATAGAGPIAFAGLMVPHMVRPFAGADERRVLLYTALAAPSLLLIADTAGRVVLSPAEMPAGIVMALVGAPVFIAILRRRSGFS
ncbi:iron chelate uptake ABC transporter family permease subunit (plasmid) [Shinella oryzae]|nr:iron chelate uptake ABC transporter family permease subunit [Shinella oryzae]